MAYVGHIQQAIEQHSKQLFEDGLKIVHLRLNTGGFH